MMNGKEYLESLRDGREVYLNGEKIDDVTTHPAYRNAARSIAQLYDAMHDPEKRILSQRNQMLVIFVPISFLKHPQVQRNC